MFFFFFLPYLLLKRHIWLSGNLRPVIRVHNLFNVSSSTCSWSLDEFVGVRVIFPFFSSDISDQPSTCKTHFINWNVILQTLSHFWLFAHPWTVAQQTSLSLAISNTLPRSCPLNRWCCPNVSSPLNYWSSCFQHLLKIRVFSNESAIFLRWT